MTEYNNYVIERVQNRGPSVCLKMQYLRIEGTKQIVKALMDPGTTKVQHLNLYENHIPFWAAFAIGKVLEMNQSLLQELDLTLNNIGREGTAVIVQGFRNESELTIIASW